MQYLEGANRILLRPSADNQLGQHEGETNNNNTSEIDENERSATIHTGDIREFPDISQSHRRAGGGQDKPGPTGPVNAR